ncbi:MAG: hypothetical protein IPF73_13470 [Betaproteobacteria bacterium]|nr:hypothetical protein [Betaproteobacteria bacterium]
MNDLRVLLAFAAPYRAPLALCALLMLAESAAALAVPWLGGKLAGALLPGEAATATGASTILAAMLALFAVQALLKFANTTLLGGTGERIVSDLKVRLYDHLQALPLSFFQQRRHGETLALLTRDVYVVGDFVSGTAIAVVPLLLTVAGSLLFMFRLQPQLALLAMVAIPLFYLVTKIVGRRIRPLASELQDEHAAAIAIAEENLGMLPAIKTFTREPQESARYRRQIDRILHLTSRQLRIQAALGPALQFVAAAGIVALLWLGGAELTRGRMTPAELVSFLLYAMLLTRPVAGLADVYGRTQSARGALARLLHALDETPEPPPNVGADAAAGEGRDRVRPRVVRLSGPPARARRRDAARGRRRDRRDRRPERRGKEHARAPADAPARARRGNHRDRRPRRRGRVAREPAPPDRRRAAARAAVQRERARQHRLRPPRSFAAGGREGRKARPRARLHRRAAAGLRHADRRSRRAPLRRPAAAPGARPRAPQGPADPDPRRGHRDVRSAGRGGIPRRGARGAGGKNRAADHASTREPGGGQPDRADGGWQDRRHPGGRPLEFPVGPASGAAQPDARSPCGSGFSPRTPFETCNQICRPEGPTQRPRPPARGEGGGPPPPPGAGGGGGGGGAPGPGGVCSPPSA